MLNDRELGAVLAGLRALQNVQQHEALAPEIADVMTDGGRFAPLDDDEIDALCERLNGGTVDGCATCAASVETRNQPCDECGHVDEDDGLDAGLPALQRPHFAACGGRSMSSMKSKLGLIGARLQHVLEDLQAVKEEAAHRDIPSTFALLEDAEEELRAALAKIDSAELTL